jgi:hypothetical protein
MTIAPFRRLNLTLMIILVERFAASTFGAMMINVMHPREGLWVVHGLYVLTRWLVGLVVAGVFVLMAHDCIRRRSTQSATGILYVAGVLIVVGEIMALYLLHETGLPF